MDKIKKALEVLSNMAGSDKAVNKLIMASMVKVLEREIKNTPKEEIIVNEAARRIDIFKWKKKEDGSGYEKILVETGLFQEYGSNFEEMEIGPGLMGVGTYSTCIIEMEDGSVRNVPVELVEFKDH